MDSLTSAYHINANFSVTPKELFNLFTANTSEAGLLRYVVVSILRDALKKMFYNKSDEDLVLLIQNMNVKWNSDLFEQIFCPIIDSRGSISLKLLISISEKCPEPFGLRKKLLNYTWRVDPYSIDPLILVKYCQPPYHRVTQELAMLIACRFFSRYIPKHIKDTFSAICERDETKIDDLDRVRLGFIQALEEASSLEKRR